MIGLAVIVGIAIGSPDMLFSRLSIYGFITGFSISSYSMIINDVYDIEIDKELKIKKDATNNPERLFVDGKIIAKSDNIAFRERSKMSTQGLLVLQIGYKTSKKKLKVQLSSFGLPRFEDYLDGLKTNAETFLNNMAKKKSRYDLDEFERFVKEDTYSISGKKPIIKITEME